MLIIHRVGEAPIREMSAPVAKLPDAEAAAPGLLHHLGGLEPELIPLLTKGVHLHALVVLHPAKERLEPLVRLVLLDAALEDLDGPALLAAFLLTPGVHSIEKTFPFVGTHGGFE